MDKLSPRLRKDRAHAAAPRFKRADQLQRLVGCDTAADDEQHAFAAHAGILVTGANYTVPRGKYSDLRTRRVDRDATGASP